MTVMLSVRPEWAHLILRGIKKAEVRLTAPEPPFDILLYVTKGGPNLPVDGTTANGYVVAKAHVDRVTRLSAVVDKDEPECWRYTAPIDMKSIRVASCMNDNQMREYGRMRTLMVWHLSRLERIGFKPLEQYGLHRPPQSWCRVKETDEDEYPDEEGFARDMYCSRRMCDEPDKD